MSALFIIIITLAVLFLIGLFIWNLNDKFNAKTSSGIIQIYEHKKNTFSIRKIVGKYTLYYRYPHWVEVEDIKECDRWSFDSEYIEGRDICNLEVAKGLVERLKIPYREHESRVVYSVNCSKEQVSAVESNYLILTPLLIEAVNKGDKEKELEILDKMKVVYKNSKE